MYQYDSIDQAIVDERARQYRGQVERRFDGSLREDEFRPLRLQNGLYRQLHAYMLRVAIPYGLLSSKQVRMLAHIARKYDRGYGHFTTRQNIQYNWLSLTDSPAILADLASVEMHAIQTSGNCIRNVTSDQLAGVARDEIEDPRPYCELIRQWSTFHPEFAFLPRKFKIAVTGAREDRAAIRFHDIGVRLVERDGRHGFEVWVGGGMGRTPVIAELCGEFVEKADLLSYLEAVLRVYNQFGRRDNIYKARIKILVSALGISEYRRLVEEEFALVRESALKVPAEELARLQSFFQPPAYKALEGALVADGSDAAIGALRLDKQLGRWARHNVVQTRTAGYAAVYLSLKAPGIPAGDCADWQLDAIADLADEYSFGEVVTTHNQNLVFCHVESSRLRELHGKLEALALAHPNMGTASDVIACPGLDYCDLANARSIPVSMAVQERVESLDFFEDLGELSIKISGCINACGHHHVGHIGILGIDKQGEEAYQLMVGGSHSDDASIGKIVGPAMNSTAVVGAVESVLRMYLAQRSSEDERFVDYTRRVGLAPFKTLLKTAANAAPGAAVSAAE